MSDQNERQQDESLTAGEGQSYVFTSAFRARHFPPSISNEAKLYWIRNLLKEVEPKDLLSEMVRILENQDIQWEAKLHLLQDILKATEAERANRLSEMLKIINDRYFQWIELTV